MILVIDNYDSFVHNLARYVRQHGVDTQVVRNDAIKLEEIASMNPQAIVISPGPCSPDEAGCSVEVIKRFGSATPIFGVCLGHQAIIQAYGGSIVRAEPVHGRKSSVYHDGSPLFNGIPTPLTVGRYHSLVAEPSSLPDSLKITSKTDDGLIMSVQHKTHPVVGVQFHPESILTEMGHLLLSNFFKMTDVKLDSNAASFSKLAQPLKNPASSSQVVTSELQSEKGWSR